MGDQHEVNGGSDSLTFCNILTFIFILLKLFRVITWKWIWVFSPMIFGWGLGFILFIILWILKSKGD